MRSPVPDYLQAVLDACADNSVGEVASYIPELGQVDADQLAVAACLPDGKLYSAGDVDTEFTIQSISKALAYAIALEQHGIAGVEEHVGVEPSGDSFNEISLGPKGRPRNPMVNIGAVTIHAIIGDPDDSAEERSQRVLDGMGAFAGRELTVDEDVMESELSEAHRNLALAHLVRSNGTFDADPPVVVTGYIRQCSAKVTVKDLAVMGMTLAMGGVNPLTGNRVVSRRVARHVLSVMATCGMYDAAGDWMTDVGIPAKSGVGGGIMGALPGQAGVATFSPKLDEFGNSARGIRVFERLSEEMGLHLMDVPVSADGVVRARDEVTVDDHAQQRVQLQGALQFGGAESALETMSEIEPGDDTVVVDVSHVTFMNEVSTRMLGDGMKRLKEDGHDVVLVDPESRLPHEDDVTVVEEL